MTETEKAVLITFMDNLPPDPMRVIKVEFPVSLEVASVHWDYLRHTVEVDLKKLPAA